MDEKEQPKWLPYAVISIWLIVAVIVLIVVLSSNPTHSRSLELIVQVITALSGAAAAIAAFLAVQTANKTLAQAREDKAAEVEAQRPKFRLMLDHMQLITSLGGDFSISPFYELDLIFKNIHAHPATNIRLECKVLQGNKKLLDFVSQPVGEVDQDGTFEVKRDLFTGDIADGVAYVRIVLAYVDGITRKEHSQLLYRKFYGPYEDDDRTQIYLLEIDRSEWDDYRTTQRKVIEAK